MLSKPRAQGAIFLARYGDELVLMLGTQFAPPSVGWQLGNEPSRECALRGRFRTASS